MAYEYERQLTEAEAYAAEVGAPLGFDYVKTEDGRYFEITSYKASTLTHAIHAGELPAYLNGKAITCVVKTPVKVSSVLKNSRGAEAPKPTHYGGVLDLIHEWIESDDDAALEEMEPEALAYMIRKLGEERDALMDIVRLNYEVARCPRCKASLTDGGTHSEECPLYRFQMMAITAGGRNQEVLPRNEGD